MVKKRNLCAFIFLSLVLFAAGTTVAMADLSDDCDGASDPGSYHNLEPPQADYTGWDSPPDASYRIQGSNRREAYALYQCPGGETASIAIYSRHGSFASRSGDRLIRGGEELPLLYHPASDEVYCQGRKMMYSAVSGEFLFADEAEAPSGLIPYGLSVEVSADGRNFSPVPRSLRSARREGPDSYWYEVYDVELGSGIRFLKVILTDQTSIQIQGRNNRYSFETAGGLALASVEIVGTEQASWAEDARSGGSIDGDQSGWEEASPVWERSSGDGSVFLPEYQPEAEEGWENPSWGPDTDAESGPAFPEELPQTEGPEEPEAPSGSASSKSAGKAAKEPGSRSKKSSSAAAAEEGPEEGGIVPVRISQPQERAAAVPLWHRILEPDIMSMLLISASLLIAAFRILWEREEESKKDRHRN